MLRTVLGVCSKDELNYYADLIDWKKEEIDLVGTAIGGNALLAEIKSLHPDMVILDTDLSGEVDWMKGHRYTGLDIIEHYHPFKHHVRFIVISEKDDYSLIRRALRCEVLDYLKKPVCREELESALRLAVTHSMSRQMMESAFTPISEFRSDAYQNGVLQIPDSDDDYERRILENCNIDFSVDFAVGIYFGLIPEIGEELSKTNYQKFSILTLSLYSRILTFFREHNIGFEVRRSGHRIRMMGVFSQKEEETYLDNYIRPLINELETTYDTRLCVGVGSHAYEPEQLYSAYKNAQYCHELYFFEQRSLITWYDNAHDIKDAHLSQEIYEKNQEEVFRAILTKSPDVYDKLEASIEALAKMHYGNWQALIMRAMNYTGEISSKLRRYRLISGDYFEAQDELQNRLLQAIVYQDVKRELMNYFKKLLPKVYKNTRHSGKVAVEQVKIYMQENFMRELSGKELAEVACVSTNYFSHMFKNETGQNYKTYLTNIRMDHAVELLLNSDYGLYEISERCGYQNVRTFVDAFKQKYVLSPTKYKKKMLEKRT